jgi:hypothetical protein
MNALVDRRSTAGIVLVGSSLRPRTSEPTKFRSLTASVG